VAVGEPGGVGAAVEDGSGTRRERDHHRHRDPGDGDLAAGGRVDRDLPRAGTPWASGDSPSSPSPDCGHTYTASSAGQPGGACAATVTITWDITRRATGGAGAVLPPLATTATVQFRVAESQALNTAGL
jgi:hypothetical protein